MIVFLVAKKEGGFEGNVIAHLFAKILRKVPQDNLDIVMVVAFHFAKKEDEFEEDLIVFLFAARKILREAKICKDFEDDFEENDFFLQRF